jgi:hypothetical protein
LCCIFGSAICGAAGWFGGRAGGGRRSDWWRRGDSLRLAWRLAAFHTRRRTFAGAFALTVGRPFNGALIGAFNWTFGGARSTFGFDRGRPHGLRIDSLGAIVAFTGAGIGIGFSRNRWAPSRFGGWRRWRCGWR